VWISSNTWLPGPIHVHNPNSILIGSAIFAGLISVTDRPTDYATPSVTTGCINVCSIVMLPNINKNNNKNICITLMMQS